MRAPPSFNIGFLLRVLFYLARYFEILMSCLEGAEVSFGWKKFRLTGCEFINTPNDCVCRVFFVSQLGEVDCALCRLSAFSVGNHMK